MFDGMAKPMPEPPATIAVLMPMTSPCMFTRGPPELPGLIAASVWTKSSNGPWPIWRALALMIPAVTVAWRPNGDPTARTQSPTWARSESPSFAAERGLAVIEPEHGEVGLLVHAEDLRLVLTAVERDHLDVGRALDDVGVGEGDPLRVHDDAGAEAPLRDALGQLAEEAAEELLAEELLERRSPLDADAPRHRVDVDDGRLDHLRHRGERHGRQRHLHRHDGHRDLGRRRRPRGWPDLARGEYAEGDADQHGDRQRAEERLPPQLHHRPAPPIAPGPFTPSPASARRSGSPSSVSTRLSSCAAATRVACLVVSIPRTRSSVRSRIARTSASIARAVSSL